MIADAINKDHLAAKMLSTFWHFDTVPVFIAASCILLLYNLYNILDRRIRKRRLSPYDPPIRKVYLPWGLDLVFESLTYAFQLQVFEMFKMRFGKYGNTYQIHVLGEWPIVTCDPDNIQAILSAQFNDFGKGPEFHRSWEFFLGNGIFNVDGDLWSTSRHLLRPHFHKQRVSDLKCFESHIQILFDLLPKKDTEIVDIQDLWFRFTLDTSTEFLFGESVESLRHPKSVFAVAFSIIQDVQTLRARIGPLWRVYWPWKFIRSMRRLNQFVEPFVERAIAAAADEQATEKAEMDRSFVETLGAFTKDKKMLRDQLVSTLLAGRDTTACTLSWLFLEFSRHPDIVRRLRAEILDCLGPEGIPTYEDLKSLKFLNNCIHEILRLYPVVPFNLRTALCDTTLPRGGGPDGTKPIAVLKGDPIGYITLCLQRREDIFGESVNDFQPDRWESWQPSRWTYIPFNAGPRVCLGM